MLYCSCFTVKKKDGFHNEASAVTGCIRACLSSSKCYPVACVCSSNMYSMSAADNTAQRDKKLALVLCTISTSKRRKHNKVNELVS